MGRRTLQWTGRRLGRRINENLDYVGLDAYRHRPPSTLSGGQKQKLAIASVLALKPTVLVMDEPTTDLDPISKMGVFEITHRLCKRDDLTLIIIEHETEEALFADRIGLIKDGKLVKIGPAREILSRYKSDGRTGGNAPGNSQIFQTDGCNKSAIDA